ncbi:transcription termination factor Rho domain protein [Mycobacterium xenopi 3993]|nr:transcription termination factor Rho domain protein [Mycobacterium xenopi 3993]
MSFSRWPAFLTFSTITRLCAPPVTWPPARRLRVDEHGAKERLASG